MKIGIKYSYDSTCLIEFNLFNKIYNYDNVVYLDCSCNGLTSLPTLSKSLKILICDFNLLTSLPILPNSLVKLYCNHNDLTSLPELPNSLVQLCCNNNLLTSLPKLPNSLKTLDCDYNHLMLFPEDFFQNLNTFYVSWNKYLIYRDTLRYKYLYYII